MMKITMQNSTYFDSLSCFINEKTFSLLLTGKCFLRNLINNKGGQYEI